MLHRRHLLLCSLLIGWGMWGNACANNLRLTGLSSDGKSVNVTVAWDNCWNMTAAPGNHDAVWLFAKVKRQGLWQPLRWATEPTAHVAEESGRLDLSPSADGLGIFLKTVAGAGGHMPETHLHVQLAEAIVGGEFEFAVYGIEMAWVNEGPFWLGDGASNFCLRDSATGQPYFVASENAIPAAAITASGANPPAAPIAAAYPKGYGGFYLMKYEISQAQYAGFLQSLTYDQQAARTASGPAAPPTTPVMAGNSALRNGLVMATPGLAPDEPAYIACNAHADDSHWADDDGQNRACNWLDWLDVAAYLDWAALRPITELEFEKACRGPIAPVALEFAWGTDSIVDANTLLHDGTATEGVAEAATSGAGLGSHGYAGVQGPLRCGFGAHAGSDRLQAGAGYYGHMELSGNLWEFCVTTQVAGLGYDGATGDGILSDAGAADVPTWPGAAGVGYKGGGWNSGVIPGFRDLAVSDRFYIGLASDIRRGTAGGRGAR